MGKTIKLTSKSGEKSFSLAHAQSILRHQIGNNCTSCWEIVGNEYEFNGIELRKADAAKSGKKDTGNKTKPVGGSTGAKSAK